MKNVKVFATHGYPLWDIVSGAYITSTPTDVEKSWWTDAQIESGVLTVVEDGQESGEAKRPKGGTQTKQPKDAKPSGDGDDDGDGSGTGDQK